MWMAVACGRGISDFFFSGRRNRLVIPDAQASQQPSTQSTQATKHPVVRRTASHIYIYVVIYLCVWAVSCLYSMLNCTVAGAYLPLLFYVMDCFLSINDRLLNIFF